MNQFKSNQQKMPVNTNICPCGHWGVSIAQTYQSVVFVRYRTHNNKSGEKSFEKQMLGFIYLHDCTQICTSVAIYEDISFTNIVAF